MNKAKLKAELVAAMAAHDYKRIAEIARRRENDDVTIQLGSGDYVHFHASKVVLVYRLGNRWYASRCHDERGAVVSFKTKRAALLQSRHQARKEEYFGWTVNHSL